MNKRLYPISEDYFKNNIYCYLAEFKDGRGRPALIKDYDFFCAVLYVMRTGIPWRDVPEQYGSWHTIYTRFKRWSESGWFWKLLKILQTKKLMNVDFTWIDSTTVAVHRHGSGALKKKGINQLVEEEKE
jgi:transposase